MSEEWNKHRWTQLFELDELLNDCITINNGSNVLERLTRIINKAESLWKSDFVSGTQSFASFLKQEAVKHLPPDTFAKKGSNDDTN